MIEVYIGLGSNMAEPRSQISQALQALSRLSMSRLLKCSSLYASEPMGPQNQANYVNGVACLHTSLTPLALLAECQNIEQQQGRIRTGERWGPRTLDLDILLYGQDIIQQPSLVIPHYGMKQREFVLYPLHEISPELRLPCGTTLVTLLESCPLNGLMKINNTAQI
ncbi:MAG: 2-amino-4-hydroxy-6-hydroxymethyldihydropteridine diphosphokinase [Paraglaciecola sp.]|jgi:2-amino-4-hydroxy-6-hydroxymethyldihydropteridine diphosphokinase